jgi:hypothetical protein
MTQANHATLSLAWETLVTETEFSTNGIGQVWARGDPPGRDPDVLAMLDRAKAMDGTTDLGAMLREISDMVFPRAPHSERGPSVRPLGPGFLPRRTG